MVAEDRVRRMESSIARTMSLKDRFLMQDRAHSRVTQADIMANRHIAVCEICQADGKKPQDHSFGQA